MANASRALSPKQIKEWGDRYRLVFPTYETYAVRLVDLIDDLARQNAVDLAQVQGRGKTVESFEDKLRRKGGKYKDPLVDVTDLAAVRVITYTLADIDRIAEMIRREFEVDESRSVVKPETIDPDRFGYISIHFVANLGSSRKSLPEWAAFDGKVFEVQLRTVLQHAWSAIDHRLNYKSTKDIPLEVRRRLFRVSALLEVADEQLDEVEQESRAVSAEYGAEVQRGNLDALAIDSASVDVYLRAYKHTKQWGPVIRGVGMTLETKDKVAMHRDRRDLINAILGSGIKTIGELDAVLQDANRWGEAVLRRVNEDVVSEDGEPVEVTIDDALTMLVIYGRRADQSVIGSVGWVSPVPETLAALVRSAKRPGRRRAGEPPRPGKEIVGN